MRKNANRMGEEITTHTGRSTKYVTKMLAMLSTVA